MFGLKNAVESINSLGEMLAYCGHDSEEWDDKYNDMVYVLGKVTDNVDEMRSLRRKMRKARIPFPKPMTDRWVNFTESTTVDLSPDWAG